MPWDGEESHRVLPKLAPEPGRGCDRLFFGPGLYWRHNKGRGRNVGNIPGSGYFAQFFCGLSAAYGDKPPFRVPPVSRSVCLGGSPGSGVQRRLPAAGVPLPGQPAVAGGVPWTDGDSCFWVEPLCLEAGGRVCPAEPGNGGSGAAIQPGKSHVSAVGGGRNLAAVPDSFRKQGWGTGVCAGLPAMGRKKGVGSGPAGLRQYPWCWWCRHGLGRN